MTTKKSSERHLPFLALPPFPKRKLNHFERCNEDNLPLSERELDELIERLAEARIGGTWWGAQPDLGREPYVLIRGTYHGGRLPRSSMAVRWNDGDVPVDNGSDGSIVGVCDPWHMLAGATELCCSSDDPVRLVAALSGVPVREGSERGEARHIERPLLRTMLAEALGERLFRNPFNGAPLPWAELIELCALWRGQIDANRHLRAVYGFAGWKRATTEPLLWDGSAVDRFDRHATKLKAGEKVAIWKSRTPPRQLAALERAGVILVEVEDGFIRSAGLGANCVPPQSIVVDEIGVHFDARSSSRLERLLESHNFDSTLLARAKALRERIVALGLSKYDRGEESLTRRSTKLHVLVPGQVEDDRAVLSSIGAPLSNLELLRRARQARPEAHLIYKPHPDVEAGHRKGAITDAAVLELADEVVRAPSISSWINLVDEVHVNSSLAGFEALMRNRQVTTYGVPFYAGWGLTEDLGPVPQRRSAKRTIDELVAATLIVYPRYVDPVTNLPCSPETLITQLSALGPAASSAPSPLTWARQLQGQVRNLLARMTGQL